MSGIAKAVKKVWRPIEKLGSKIANITTLGLHKKWKKVRHKIVKSKIFKVVVAAVAIYFGGAALLSMAGGGTASAGIGSAWAGAQGAGSAAMAGNFSGAVSALGSGFTGASAAGASTAALTAAGEVGAGFGAQVAAGAQYTGGMIANNAAIAGTAGSIAAGAGAAPTLAANSGSNIAANAATNVATNEAGKASGGLLSSAWNGLGEAGKAAVITSGVNMAGQALQGKAQQEASEEERKRRTYWGVDGEGNQNQQPGTGLLNIQPYQPYTPAAAPGAGDWRTTIDDLINRTKQTGGGY